MGHRALMLCFVLWAASGGDAGNALEVADEFNVVEAGAVEEGFDVGLLAETEFEDEVAAGDEGAMGGGNEAAVDGKAVFTAEEGDMRFMFADLDGNEGAVGVGDVGWVGDDDLELVVCDR